jgi:peptidoglycan/xylan/chitin deacetylase (PgdA/CDA1 family)
VASNEDDACNDAKEESTTAALTDAEPAASAPEFGTARRLTGEFIGSTLMYTGTLARCIARVRDENLVTHIYGHQPDPRQFRDCLEWLLNRGYVPVSTADIVSAQRGEKRLPSLALHVSLDDAFRSNLTGVVPVAQDLGVPVTIFVPTEPVDRGWYWWTCVERMANDDYRTVERLKSLPNAERLESLAEALRRCRPQREAMTLEELQRIASLDHVTIGSHTVTHPILTKCSDAELERELVDSREQLERWIGRPVTAFAYPNGSFGEREVEAVRRAGYSVAFTVEQRHAFARGDDPYRLPRLALTNNGPLIENLCRAVGIWQMPQWQPWRGVSTSVNEIGATQNA